MGDRTSVVSLEIFWIGQNLELDRNILDQSPSYENNIRGRWLQHFTI
jgi:hypothetical protein